MISRHTLSALLLMFSLAAIGLQGCTHNNLGSNVSVSPDEFDPITLDELDHDFDHEQIKEHYKRIYAPFTCTFEKNRLPRLNSDADRLFQHARWLETKNPVSRGLSFASVSFASEDDFNFIEYQKSAWLYRLAAASGHWKASKHLADMLIYSESGYDRHAISQSGSTLEEIMGTNPIKIAEDLIQRGIPYGYFLKGIQLDRYNKQFAAQRYIRKAADMGSPDAQYLLWDNVMTVRGDRWDSNGIDSNELEAVTQMLHCAANQGHGEAAFTRGITLQRMAIQSEQDDERARLYTEAVKYFQVAVKAGHLKAASRLHDGFNSQQPPDWELARRMLDNPDDFQMAARLDFFFASSGYLALPKDQERSERYAKILDTLLRYEHLNPTVDELDKIVPLPPSRLPPWDGEIDWVKRLEKNEPPPLPSEQRIAKMARAKGLEPVFEPKLSTTQRLHLPFTCTHEKDRLPPPNPEADMLFRHANWLHKQSGSDPCHCDPKAERLFRIAAAWGHWDAVRYFADDLQYAHSVGDVQRVSYLTGVAENLIQRNIPYGYYLMGVLLERGDGDVWHRRNREGMDQEENDGCDPDDHQCRKQARDKAWQDHYQKQEEAPVFFRKAADLGSPEAQYQLRNTQGFGSAMYQCAVEQGHYNAMESRAAELREVLDGARQLQKYGELDSANESYVKVIKFLQSAARAGNIKALGRLLEGFIGDSGNYRLFENEESATRFYMILTRLENANDRQPVTVDEIDRIIRLPSSELPPWESILTQRGKRIGEVPSSLPSEERIEGEESARRFFMIQFRLQGSDNQQPTVDEIDRIIRLPSSELPSWESIFLQRWNDGSPPPLPSEERIAEMAREKNLDPETGLPVNAAGAKQE